MKRIVVAAVAVVLALAAGYFGDNVARGYAENRAANAVAQARGVTEPDGSISVGLGGFPFSVAYLTNTVPSSTLSASSLPVKIHGQQIELIDLRIATAGVQLGSDTVTAEAVSGTADLSYAHLSALVGVQLGAAEDGRIKVSSGIELFGKKMSADISAETLLDVDAQVIRLIHPKLLLGSADLEMPLSELVFEKLAGPLKVQLPGSLRLTSFAPGSQTVSAGFAADSVTLPLR